MAEINQQKMTPYQEEMIESAKKIVEYKLSTEANVVSIIYKNPEVLYENSLSRELFSDNRWKVYFEIAYGIIVTEKKSVIDDIVIGFYLEKHPKLREKYDEYGGYAEIKKATAYVKTENFESYVSELKKWKSVLELCKRGFPIKDRLSDFVDMSAEDIYNEYEVFLNHTFTSSSDNIKSFNGCENINGFIDELNDSKDVGLPLYNSPLLTSEIGGFNLNGNIYGLGASSGTGKSTMAFNYLVPSAIEHNEKIVFIINEEDERKMKKELLIWVSNNIIKPEKPIQKKTIRDGNFDENTMKVLRKAADWIEEKKEQHIFTIIPLEKYSVNAVVKIIRKYTSAFGVRMFVLDTLKESYDAKTDEIFKSMMRDTIALYDTVKPSAKNVGLFITYQLNKASLKSRHLTNNEIGQAKSIIDVMSVNLMMRRPFEDEFDGESKALKCYKIPDNSHSNTKVQYKLEKSKNPMITFITKNRFGETDTKQIISECDLSTNIYKDVAYCIVPQDW